MNTTMYCGECGRRILESAAFCPNCGWKNPRMVTPIPLVKSNCYALPEVYMDELQVVEEDKLRVPIKTLAQIEGLMADITIASVFGDTKEYKDLYIFPLKHNGSNHVSEPLPLNIPAKTAKCAEITIKKYMIGGDVFDVTDLELKDTSEQIPEVPEETSGMPAEFATVFANCATAADAFAIFKQEDMFKQPPWTLTAVASAFQKIVYEENNTGKNMIEDFINSLCEKNDRYKKIENGEYAFDVQDGKITCPLCGQVQKEGRSVCFGCGLKFR